MITKRFIFSILGLTILLSCHTKPFDKEEELYILFKEIGFNLENHNGYVFLLLEQACSMCQQEDLNHLKSRALESDKNIVIITTVKGVQVANKHRRNLHVIYCPLPQIQQSGVTQVTSLFFLLRNGHIKEWLYLNDDSVDKLMKRL